MQWNKAAQAAQPPLQAMPTPQPAPQPATPNINRAVNGVGTLSEVPRHGPMMQELFSDDMMPPVQTPSRIQPQISSYSTMMPMSQNETFQQRQQSQTPHRLHIYNSGIGQYSSTPSFPSAPHGNILQGFLGQDLSRNLNANVLGPLANDVQISSSQGSY